MTRIVTCRSHCRACDSCFTADRWFDAHRQGSHQDGTRYCAAPDEVEGLEPVDGLCRISSPPHERATLIYGNPTRARKTAETFSRKHAKPSEAKSA